MGREPYDCWPDTPVTHFFKKAKLINRNKVSDFKVVDWLTVYEDGHFSYPTSFGATFSHRNIYKIVPPKGDKGKNF